VIVNKEFRHGYFSDFEGALEEYNLTPEERDSLKTLNRQEIEDFASRLDSVITESKWIT